ncbi:LysR family transcriptional regulator [Ramlibacter sp. AN1015]|uniref:LysR family transcriptional regulator n=1 Tax=Ramlibacter sp. AN1015 TaxID=3133428 RepID=UPI0030BA5E30
MAIHKKPLSALPSVRQLRAFLTVYQVGSVSAAAEQLALTQPAVTVLLRELEARLGLRLFDRSTRALRPTEAAAEAAGYAQRALAELEGMASRMRELAQGRTGRVRLAATATVAATLLPPAMQAFRALHPEVKVEVEEVAPEGFVELLLSERVDFGVGTIEAPVAALREEVFMRDALVVVARADTVAFPAGASMTWKQLAPRPVVTVKPGYGIRRRIDEAARAAGVQLRIEHEVSLLTTALAMAAHGLAAAIVPASVAAQAAWPHLLTRRLVRPAVDRPIGIVWKRDRSLSPAARAFAEVLHARHRG